MKPCKISHAGLRETLGGDALPSLGLRCAACVTIFHPEDKSAVRHLNYGNAVVPFTIATKTEGLNQRVFG